MGKGTDAHVLARQTHAVTVLQQGCVRHGLGKSPVDGHGTEAHLVSIFHDLLNLALENEPIRELLEPLGERLDHAEIDPRVRRHDGVVAKIGPPVHEQLRVRFVHQAQCHVPTLVQRVPVRVRKAVGLALLNEPFRDQAFHVDRPGRRVLADLLVHQGLG